MENLNSLKIFKLLKFCLNVLNYKLLCQISSISKEYDLPNQSEPDSCQEPASDYHVESDRQFSFSSDDFVSDSSQTATKKLSKTPQFLTIPKQNKKTSNVRHHSPITVTREKHDQQAKLNFSLNLNLANFNLNILNQSRVPANTTLLLHKLTTKIEINSIFQKIEFKLKKLLFFNDSVTDLSPVNALKRLIINTDPDLLKHFNNNSKSQQSPSASNFLDLTFTRALVSNLNKKLYQASSPLKPINSRAHSFRTNQKWILEVNCTLNDLDLLIHLERLVLLNQIIDLADLTSSKFNCAVGPSPSKTRPSKQNLIPLIKASDAPLINFEINRIRLIVPSLSGDFLNANLPSLNISSQMTSPLIRNFHAQSSVSASVYHQAKSSGHLYMPGFAFEDRQYSLDLSQFTVTMRRRKTRAFQSVLAGVDLKAVIGLPIIAGKKLIHGYVCEIGVVNQETCVYLSNESINLVCELIKENAEVTAKLSDEKSKMIMSMDKINDEFQRVESEKNSKFTKKSDNSLRSTRRLQKLHTGKNFMLD